MFTDLTGYMGKNYVPVFQFYLEHGIGQCFLDRSLNLYKFAAKDVEVQGWWAGQKKDTVKTFVPVKIRLKGTSDWTDVETAQMH